MPRPVPHPTKTRRPAPLLGILLACLLVGAALAGPLLAAVASGSDDVPAGETGCWFVLMAPLLAVLAGRSLVATCSPRLARSSGTFVPTLLLLGPMMAMLIAWNLVQASRWTNTGPATGGPGAVVLMLIYASALAAGIVHDRWEPRRLHDAVWLLPPVAIFVGFGSTLAAGVFAIRATAPATDFAAWPREALPVTLPASARDWSGERHGADWGSMSYALRFVADPQEAERWAERLDLDGDGVAGPLLRGTVKSEDALDDHLLGGGYTHRVRRLGMTGDVPILYKEEGRGWEGRELLLDPSTGRVFVSGPVEPVRAEDPPP